VAPVIEELARAEAGRVVVAKVNVDEEPSLAQRYGVQAIPTLLFFRDGQVVDTVVGAPPKAELARRLTALA
jgi:thioredoxin-like negative regulator of GroEL